MDFIKDLIGADVSVRVHSVTVFCNKAGLIAPYDEGFGPCTVEKSRHCGLNHLYSKLLNSEVKGEALVANCQSEEFSSGG